MTMLIVAAALAAQCPGGVCTVPGGFTTRYRGTSEYSYESTAPMAYEAIPRAVIGPPLDLDIMPDIPLGPGEYLVPGSIRVRVLPYATAARRPILRPVRPRYRERFTYRARGW